MRSVTHAEQQKFWDEEHKNPSLLHQMDSATASSGVVTFWDYARKEGHLLKKGVEIGCGKGRNAIFLAAEGVEMHGFDFSPAAIEEARRRAAKANVPEARFEVRDVTLPWPEKDNVFDFAINCFATTDIESEAGRAAALSEIFRTLRPGGLFLAYLLSPDDEFHKEMIRLSPAHEKNSFAHATGKFEKVFDEDEIAKEYAAFETVKKDRLYKKTIFFGKEYECSHFLLVFRKPLA